MESKVNDSRLEFFLGEKSKAITFEQTLQTLLGYTAENKSNVTVIDLSGVPFEVLSITVSLISRLIFEYGYIYKRLRCAKDSNEKVNNDVPILLVYEEAHKYVPNSELSKYRLSPSEPSPLTVLLPFSFATAWWKTFVTQEDRLQTLMIPTYIS